MLSRIVEWLRPCIGGVSMVLVLLSALKLAQVLMAPEQYGFITEFEWLIVMIVAELLAIWGTA